MIRKSELAEAARYADAQTEEHGVEEFCAGRGVDPRGVAQVAEQRALRALMLMRGDNPNVTHATQVALDSVEQKLLLFITASVMDGMMIGLYAKEREATPPA